MHSQTRLSQNYTRSQCNEHLFFLDPVNKGTPLFYDTLILLLLSPLQLKKKVPGVQCVRYHTLDRCIKQIIHTYIDLPQSALFLHGMFTFTSHHYIQVYNHYTEQQVK